MTTVIFITGANTGLGLQTIKAIYASDKPYDILLGGRSINKAERAAKDVVAENPNSKSSIHPIQIDIEDDSSIAAAAETIKEKFGRLDVLINNAGAQFDQQHTTGTMSMRDLWTKSWTVNTVGTQLLTTALVPLLLLSPLPRLLFITSGTSTLTGTENPSLPINRVPAAGWPKTATPAQSNIAAYRSAKCGLNMMMREWHRVLGNDGVRVWCVSPGFLATGLGGSQEANKAIGAGDPAVGAGLIRSVVEGGRDGDVGKVVLKGSVQPW